MSDGWTKAVVWNIEIDERAAHKDSGRMDPLVECVLAVYKEYVQALLGEQSSALETGESGADNGYVKFAHNTSKLFT